MFVLIGSEVVLPRYADRAAREAALAQLPGAEHVEARVRSFPALRLLQGDVGAVTVEISGVELDRVRVAEIVVTGRRVRVDVEALKERRVEVRSAEELRVRFAFAAEDLAAALEEAAGGLVPMVVELLPPDAVRLVGRFEILGETFQFGVDGRFEVVAPTRIRWVPVGVIFSDARVSGGFVEEILGGLGLEVDVGEMPLPLRIERVSVIDGRLIVEAAWAGEGGAPAAGG